MPDITGEITIQIETGKDCDGGREIQEMPHAMLTFGNVQIDITREIEVLMERHSLQLTTLVEEKEDRQRQGYLKEDAASSLQHYLGMRN